MRAFTELVPFAVHSLGASPFTGFWPFNPSIVRIPDDAPRDAGKWLCSVRCANYHLPGSGLAPSRTIGPIRNRNLMLTIDPATWAVTGRTEIKNESGIAGQWNPALGFEDLRLVWAGGGLLATASAMRLETGMLEIVVLALDRDYQIIDAHPLRGPWSSQHQKNFSPYAEASQFRALYSVLGGGVHDLDGRVVPTHPSPSLAPVDAPRGPPLSQFANGSMEVRIRHGNAMAVPPKPARLALRGGTQLVEVAPDQWLGIAHGCQIGVTKYYWHSAYTVNSEGELLSLSEPFKLAPGVGIEFAAGLAIDPVTHRIAISFGIEDDSAHLGIAQLEDVLGLLSPVPAPAPAAQPQPPHWQRRIVVP